MQSREAGPSSAAMATIRRNATAGASKGDAFPLAQTPLRLNFQSIQDT